MAGKCGRSGEGLIYSPGVVSVQFSQSAAIGPDRADDLLDVLLHQLKKYNELNRLLRQERDAVRAGDLGARRQLSGLRQRLEEQLLALEGDYRRVKTAIARQIGLDDMDFATLAGCLPPEPAAFLRRAYSELYAAAQETAALRAEVSDETRRVMEPDRVF